MGFPTIITGDMCAQRAQREIEQAQGEGSASSPGSNPAEPFTPSPDSYGRAVDYSLIGMGSEVRSPQLNLGETIPVGDLVDHNRVAQMGEAGDRAAQLPSSIRTRGSRARRHRSQPIRTSRVPEGPATSVVDRPNPTRWQGPGYSYLRAQSRNHPYLSYSEDAYTGHASLERGLTSSLDPDVATLLDDLFGEPLQS